MVWRGARRRAGTLRMDFPWSRRCISSSSSLRARGMAPLDPSHPGCRLIESYHRHLSCPDVDKGQSGLLRAATWQNRGMRHYRQPRKGIYLRQAGRWMTRCSRELKIGRVFHMAPPSRSRCPWNCRATYKDCHVPRLLIDSWESYLPGCASPRSDLPTAPCRWKLLSERSLVGRDAHQYRMAE